MSRIVPNKGIIRVARREWIISNSIDSSEFLIRPLLTRTLQSTTGDIARIFLKEMKQLS